MSKICETDTPWQQSSRRVICCLTLCLCDREVGHSRDEGIPEGTENTSQPRTKNSNKNTIAAFVDEGFGKLPEH